MSVNALHVFCGSKAEAEKIGRVLIEEGLAACANIMGEVRSIYRWQGKIEEGAEWLLILKTSHAVLPQIIDRVRTLHSYELPAIVAYDVAAGLDPYLSWVETEINAQKGGDIPGPGSGPSRL